MAMQAGVSSPKVLILVGAGLAGSVILRNGRLSDIISELQELVKGVNEVEASSYKFDSELLAAQIRRLAQEVKDLTLASPVTIVNGTANSDWNLASYILPAAALGAMGYCYMWWKDWSFSDVMFVTKRNMVSAVANVSKQLEQISAALATTKRHLTLRIENLDGKLDEQKEVLKLISDDVNDVRTDLSQIGYDINTIQQMIFGLEDKVGRLEHKQDISNSGIQYLCQIAGGIKDGFNAKFIQDFTAKLELNQTKLSFSEANSLKIREQDNKFVEISLSIGLQFLAEPTKPGEREKYKKIVQKGSYDSLLKIGHAAKARDFKASTIGISMLGEDALF